MLGISQRFANKMEIGVIGLEIRDSDCFSATFLTWYTNIWLVPFGVRSGLPGALTKRPSTTMLRSCTNFSTGMLPRNAAMT